LKVLKTTSTSAFLLIGYTQHLLKKLSINDTKYLRSNMHLLLDVDVPNFNLCCLLITQCSQKGTVTFVSPWSNFLLERIFKPFFDMWPSFLCHIIVFSSEGLDDAIDASTSLCVSLINIKKFAAIFLAFKTTSALLMIFMIPLSIQILKPRISNCPTDKIFFYKPFTCRTSKIV